jgi:CubicO group peptidase (beta-lactamase class C family)
MDSVRSAVRDLVRAGEIPSASIFIKVDGEDLLSASFGLARLQPFRQVAPDQAYDLASVTKCLVGASVAASLVANGRLSLDVPVVQTIPTVDPRITLRHLLHHTSGLPAWNDFYERIPTGWGTESARRLILDSAAATKVASEPGKRHCYTDIGFLVLTDLLERAGQAPLETLFEERILRPAGVRDLRWGWPRAAATEDCPVRGHVIEGTVHDLNCAAMGGISAHAGLFGPASAVAALGQALLDAVLGKDNGLPGSTLASFWSAPSGLGSHRLGFDSISDGYTSTGLHFPSDTVGHLGYTGTSLWITPFRRTVVVLLTNRVHPKDKKKAIRAARPIIHDAVAAALGWDKPGP